jgi:hypothetical protein
MKQFHELTIDEKKRVQTLYRIAKENVVLEHTKREYLLLDMDVTRLKKLFLKRDPSVLKGIYYLLLEHNFDKHIFIQQRN